jgi:hypothetical protein
MKAKDELVSKSASVLAEMIGLSGQDWDRCYYRFCRVDEGYKNSSWSFVKNNLLRLTKLDRDDLLNQYFDALEGLSTHLFREVLNESGRSPIVMVLEVCKSGVFNIKFDYDDEQSLQISRLYMGKPNSYFVGTDVTH